jgi:hypothetical protein
MKMRMKRTLAFVLIAGGPAAIVSGQSLATAPPNNGSGGIFLDLTAASAALQVNSFDTYFSSAAGSSVTVEVYTRPGSYVGFTTSNAGWTLHTTATGTSAGTTALGPLPLNVPIQLPVGSTVGVYLHATTTGGGIRYTGTGTIPPQTTWSNADLTLFSDVSRTGAIPFAGTQFTPRTFAGVVNYAPSDPNATGACCFGNGTCQVLSPANCATAGGSYAGTNLTCAQANCPQPGACCLPNNTCSQLVQSACISQNGVFQGSGSSCSTACVPGSTVIALDVRAATNRILSFGVNLPNQNQISTTAIDAFAMDYDGAATTLYAITNPGNQLGTLDPATGNFTPIATISGDGALEANWSGLSFDASNNTWYASAVATGTNNLYTINIGTGATTLIGSMGATELFIDIAVNDSGNMFAHDIGTDSIYSVNKTTGATTLVGATGVLCNFAQGMDFDPATDTLYATMYEGGGVGRFASINTTTGAATTVAVTTSWNAEMEMAVQAPAGGGACYANCDGSTTTPVLNVADFTCFLQRYAAGESYANCDNSTTPPVLNVADFTCFLQQYAAGCP